MTCEEFEELSGAYALDAVTPAESEAARAHLAGCIKCTRRLQELRAVVDFLPLSVTQMYPPASLRERLLSAIRREKETESAKTIRTPIPIRRNEGNRQRRQGWAVRILAVAAVLMLALLGGMTAWNVSLQHSEASFSQQNTSLQQQVNGLEPRVALSYGIQGASSTHGATGKLIYLPEQHLTVLIMQGLPQLRGTLVYQGWLIHNNQPKSIGLLFVQNGVASVDFQGDITGYELAAVSVEPGPTASKNVPAGQVVATGKLSHGTLIF